MPPDHAERINRLERQVQYLLQYIGVDPETAAAGHPAFGAGAPAASAESAVGGYSASGPGASAPSPEIVALIQDGKLVQAIKVYRHMTGAGLKEAKDVIDAMRADMGLGRRR